MHRRPALASIGWSDADGIAWLTAFTVAMPVVAAAFARWGTPRVDVMWPFHRAGIVGPSCGLTRAVVALARGDPGRAWHFNPAVYLVVVGAVVLIGRAVVGVTAGRWLAIRLAHPRLVVAVGLALAGLLWANQQLHADFLLHHLR